MAAACTPHIYSLYVCIKKWLAQISSLSSPSLETRINTGGSGRKQAENGEKQSSPVSSPSGVRPGEQEAKRGQRAFRRATSNTMMSSGPQLPFILQHDDAVRVDDVVLVVVAF
jgi:hypothetical protein